MTTNDKDQKHTTNRREFLGRVAALGVGGAALAGCDKNNDKKGGKGDKGDKAEKGDGGDSVMGRGDGAGLPGLHRHDQLGDRARPQGAHAPADLRLDLRPRGLMWELEEGGFPAAGLMGAMACLPQDMPPR